jgi:hypothetical protein
MAVLVRSTTPAEQPVALASLVRVAECCPEALTRVGDELVVLLFAPARGVNVRARRRR